MIDFWVAAILTTIVTILTVSADWLLWKLITGAKIVTSIRKILAAGLSADETENRVRAELERYRSSLFSLLVWGADLATVAIAMDLAALGIWIHNTSMFPFFSRFNTMNTSREIPVWLIVIGLHVFLLVLSLALKHRHAEAVTWLPPAMVRAFPSKAWFGQNSWMIAANAMGFTSLLTSIAVFTNAL